MKLPSIYSFKSHVYIHLNVCKQMTDVKLWLLHGNTWNHLTVCKQMTDVKLLLFHSNTWKHLTVCKKKMSLGSF